MSIVPKTRRRRNMLLLALFLSVGVSLTLFLAVIPMLGKNNYFSMYYTPSQVASGEAPLARRFKVGGMVVKGSVKRLQDGVTVQFQLTDFKHTATVQFKGILPDMFTVNQAAIAEGQMTQKKVFVATKVLAKHDEKYMPPSVKSSLKKYDTNKPVSVPAPAPNKPE